ncbi:MAG: alkaline phosphatase family protein, partial [Actinomycetota bacterium]|nr:alkaline phosphatase family protein [Actinomycetota bacterium]
MRRLLTYGLAASLAIACTGEPEQPPGAPPGAPSIEEMATRLGGDVMRALVHGYHPQTSADIAFVPQPYNVVVRWSGEGLGTDLADPRTTHPTPWSYHQRVPIVLYGPGAAGERGFVPAGARWRNPIDVTLLPSTLASLLHTRFGPAEPLPGAVRGAGVPKAVVVIAYDGGGWNLLEEWPKAWPVLRGMMEGGTVYTNATIGSAPAVTSAIHANMGTGTYPSSHGVAEITARLPDGSVGDVFFGEEADPELLLDPTFADQWDRENGNDPWVGMIGYESWHLGMMSHGAGWPGGDRDVAVLWEQEPGIGEFFTNEELYELPEYLPGEEDLQARLDALDAQDGAIDGSWRGYDLADPKVVPATPAFVEHQGDALLRLLEREPIGDDDVTDLIFVEMKPTDFGGHLWNMVAPEEERVLRAQDDVLGEIVDALDREVGRGEWVLAMTADHGQTPKPETTGGLRIHPDLLGRAVDDYFGRTIVQKVTPSGMFLHLDAMHANGITLEEVARFIGDYRYGDGLPADTERSGIPEETLNRRVFAAALPSSFLAGLTEGTATAFGPGEYPEGDLTSP